MIREINDIYNGKIQDKDCPFLNKVFDNGFTIAEMLQYNSPDERCRYASTHLRCIGHGLRRVVFDLGKYVLKLTRGEHRYQSKNEYDTNLLSGEFSELFPHTIYQSRDFSWSIVEKVEPITNDKCQQILGVDLTSHSPNIPSIEGFQLWAETKARQVSRQSPNKVRMVNRQDNDVYAKLLKTNPWFKALYRLELSQRSNLDYGTDLNPSGTDFTPSNLGVATRNGKECVVILDAGFIKPFDTRKIEKKYGIKSLQMPPITTNESINKTKIVRLTEQDLHNIIEETIKHIIREKEEMKY